MQKADPLIRTKLHLPFTRPELVSRQRLQEQIAQGLHAPLTLITAPAGFGKTTLVAQCAAGCEMPVAWLSLDKDDNQSGRFLRYLIAALQEANELVGGGAAQLISGIHQPLQEAVLISLINDLDGCGAEIVVMLDDYQLISSQQVHEAVIFLLEHQPASLHIVVATRSDPPLPLARLRARGQIVELRAADLRFTESEAGQFLQDVMGLCLDTRSIALLADRTEGWIAGLQMAALSMRDRKDICGFIEGFSGTNRYILDYLLEEVLACQTPDIQHFLLYTSILERMTAPLCDAVLSSDEGLTSGSEDGSLNLELLPLRLSASVLKFLERVNLFLVPLDDESIWYRYHHLFADLLKTRLQEAQPDLINTLHIRASAWFEQKGLIAEAVHHLFAAHEMDRAADLLEQYGSSFWEKGDPSLIQLAEVLPPHMMIERPKIGLLQIWLLITQGHIRKAYPLLTDLANHLASTELNSGQRWMKTIAVLALAFLAPPASIPSSDPLPDFEDLGQIPPGELILRDTAEILYGMAAARRGEMDRAADASIKCIQRPKSPLEAQAIPSVAPFLARVFLIQGRLHSASDLCRKFLDPNFEKGILFTSSAGSMNITLGEVLYEWNCLEEAEQQIRAGLRSNGPWQNIMTDGFGLSALPRVLQARGDYAAAMQAVEEFETRLYQVSQPREFYEDLRTLKVRLQIAGGDIHSASQWTDRVQFSEDFRLFKEYYRLPLARIFLELGKYAEVEEILAGVLSDTSANNRISKQIEFNLLKAAAYAKQNRLPDAIEIIERCLALAEPEGYIRTFIDVGEAARELLVEYLRSKEPAHKSYAQQLLAAFSSHATDSSGLQTGGLIEPLSNRELEVLQLIAAGRTNQEIAHQLVVAPGTIKAHAANIYRKLDAANRTEAVAHARKLGVLT